MRRLQFGIVSLLMVTTVSAIGLATYRYIQYSRRVAEIETCVEQIGESDFPEKHELYRRIFVLAEEDILRDLIKHENDSVAIQSAWETAVRTIPEDGINKPYKPDPTTTELFLTVLTERFKTCLLYTSPSPRDATLSRMPSSA